MVTVIGIQMEYRLYSGLGELTMVPVFPTHNQPIIIAEYEEAVEIDESTGSETEHKQVDKMFALASSEDK